MANGQGAKERARAAKLQPKAIAAKAGRERKEGKKGARLGERSLAPSLSLRRFLLSFSVLARPPAGQER